MAYFGVPQRSGLAFGLSARQFAKAFATLIFALTVLFIMGGTTASLIAFVTILVIGMVGFFYPIQELPMFNWIETHVSHGLKTHRWKPAVLEHTMADKGMKADYSALEIELKRAGGRDYVSHAWGNTLLWKIDMPSMNGFAYLPRAQQSAMLHTIENLMQEIGRNPGVLRFGFTTLDMPSTADGIKSHLESLPVPPPDFYRQVAEATATNMRDVHIWLFVAADPSTELNALFHSVTSALQMASITANALSITDIAWHVIGLLSDPFTWAERHKYRTFSAPFPEMIKADLDLVRTDRIRHVCRMATMFPRQEVGDNWWALAQPRLDQPNVALATTVIYDVVSNDVALKTAGKTLQAAEGALHEAQAVKGKADFAAVRQLQDASRRNEEIVSGAALHRITLGYHVMSDVRNDAFEAVKRVDSGFRASGIDVQSCHGRQLEAFRMLMPFGCVRSKGMR
ncbi:MAG: PrgI family protein [Ferrimicrobium sp.]